MCLAINEITRTESNVSVTSPEPFYQSNEFKILNISSLLNEDSVSIPEKTPKEGQDFNFENVKNPKPKITGQAITNIDNTRTILDYVSQFSSDEKYGKITASTDGVLGASRGLLNFTNVKSSTNKPRTISSSIASLAGGISTLLKQAEIPEAELLTFTGKLFGFNVERMDLQDNLKKKDERGIVGSIVLTAKSAWGAVVSGVNVAKVGVTLGATFELVSSETYGKVTTFASKVGKIADKLAIPFALIGTGLSFWDWRKAANKADTKEFEISKIIYVNKNSTLNNTLQSEFKTLQTNSNFTGLSFAASALSTSALIASVAFPTTSIITGPLTVAFGLASSVLTILADDKIRDSFKRH